METFSALLAIYAGNSPVPGKFPAQRPVTRSLDVYFDLRPNKQLSKQSWGWWFETPSRPLWRHTNDQARTKRKPCAYFIPYALHLHFVIKYNCSIHSVKKKSIWGLQSWSTINTTSRMCFKSLYNVIYLTTVLTLQWLHNERDGVPNHRSLDFLLNRLFRRRSKKTPKAPRHWPLLVCCMSWLWYNYTYMECIGLYFRYNWPIKSTKPGTDILIPVYFIWLCERNICQVIWKKIAQYMLITSTV